jgi:chromosome segregation ATPase
MSFVGKMLVVAQVILSGVFMAVAAAVFAAHANWRDVAMKKDEQLKDVQSQANLVRDNAEKEKNSLTAKYEESNEAYLKAKTEVENLQTNLAALAKDKNDLQAQISTQTGIAQTKANEAGYRDEEARNERIINAGLQQRLDGAVQDIRQRDDELFTMRADYGDLQQRHDELLAQNEFLRRVVAKTGASTDPREVARLQAPPPPVEGLVSEVKKDRTGRPHLITITVGNDDGLVKGHEMDAFRSGIDGRKPQYLGRVRVLSTTQNTAVCEVIDSAKNGIIEVGDNVTTKLL